MSQRLINRSDDLVRLRNEGYNIAIAHDHLLVRDVPFLNARKEVQRGVLVSHLEMTNDVTDQPKDHVALFIGEHPCNIDGAEIPQIKHGGRQDRGNGLVIDHSFSAKPVAGLYKDYYDKVTTYVAIVGAPAHTVDSTVTAKTFPIVRPDPDGEDSVFNYMDTASSRAGIGAATQKLKLDRVAIVGLGGTGSYVFDFVAKTPVKEIHLFDRDVFRQHNAFRAPGAATPADLEARLSKVAYLQRRYAPLRNGIVAHEIYIDESTVEQLKGMNFVFLCIDGSAAKKQIVDRLVAFGVPFIDTGMGVELVDGSLRGILRVTTAVPEKHDHLSRRISFSNAGDDVYDLNIQIADLNALSAAMAVIKWKKICGFYLDFEGEHNSSYTINSHLLTSDDRLCEGA